MRPAMPKDVTGGEPIQQIADLMCFRIALAAASSPSELAIDTTRVAFEVAGKG